MKYAVWFVGLTCTFNAFAGLVTVDLLGDASVYSLLDTRLRAVSPTADWLLR